MEFCACFIAFVGFVTTSKQYAKFKKSECYSIGSHTI